MSAYAKGTHDQIGRQVGEEFRRKINNLLRLRRDILLGSVEGISLDDVERVCRVSVNSVKRYTPTVYTEINAVAEAANISVGEMMIAGGYTDLIDVLGKVTHPLDGECTVISRTDDRAIFGTWDSHVTAKDSLILLERHLSCGLKTLALSTAGWPAQQGINNCGIAFAITNLTPKTSNPSGLNYIAANAYIADCRNIFQFLHFAKHTPFQSGHSFILSDSKGNGFVVETSASGISKRKTISCDCQTNHYIDIRLDNNSNYSFMDGSKNRRFEAQTSLSSSTDAYKFKKALKLSQYINKSDPNSLAYTCGHFYLSTTQNKVWYSGGPATEDDMLCMTLE